MVYLQTQSEEMRIILPRARIFRFQYMGKGANRAPDELTTES